MCLWKFVTSALCLPGYETLRYPPRGVGPRFTLKWFKNFFWLLSLNCSLATGLRYSVPWRSAWCVAGLKKRYFQSSIMRQTRKQKYQLSFGTHFASRNTFLFKNITFYFQNQLINMNTGNVLETSTVQKWNVGPRQRYHKWLTGWTALSTA